MLSMQVTNTQPKLAKPEMEFFLAHLTRTSQGGLAPSGKD